MTNLDKIKEACIKANPEIMELKVGCEVMYGDDLKEPCKVTLGNPYIVENNEVFNPWNRDDTSDLFEILGRPIRLADVLLVIFQAQQQRETVKIVLFWNLKDDNLEHQSEETLAFIASLLPDSK